MAGFSCLRDLTSLTKNRLITGRFFCGFGPQLREAGHSLCVTFIYLNCSFYHFLERKLAGDLFVESLG